MVVCVCMIQFTSIVLAVLCVRSQLIPASRAQPHTVFYTVHRDCQEKMCVEHSHFQVERLPEVKKKNAYPLLKNVI